MLTYRYTLAMGYLATGKIFESMLQSKGFGLHFEGVMNRKWLYFHIEIMIISYRDAREFGGMLPPKKY